MEGSVGCEDDEIWGTWEDLLLVCAVHRHGSNDWHSVTMEVRNRSRCFPDVLTAQECKRRYYLLRRRFTVSEVEGGDGEDRRKKDASASPEISWLEELRKLRVAELRREVQKYDVSIVSLQSKLKRLTEERERSVIRREEDVVSDGKADLVESVDRGEDQRAVTPPADVAGDLSSGDRPGGSCNESNSPESKGRTRQPEAVDVKMEETVEAEKPDLTTGGEHKLAGEESCNGSTDSLAKVRIMEEEDCRTNICARLPESGESIAESKGDAAKENSDVQSSASLPKKKRGHRRKATISCGSSGGDSREADEVSPISRDSNLKSQPLASFLEIIRSQKDFSIFERRLEIQESARYRSMIRQHIDLEAIRSKVEGSAFYANIEFFRDLLLLCNNAIVFFTKDTSEFSAATRLRQVINKEISANKNYKEVSTSIAAIKKPTTTAAPSEPPPVALLPEKAAAVKLKSEVEADNSVVEKLTTTGQIPLLACRKRSSISAKAAASAVAEMTAAKEEKEEKEEKPDLKKEEKPDLKKELEDKKSRERPVARGFRTTKSRGAAIRKRLIIESSNPKPDPIQDSTPEPTKPSEKKNGASGSNNTTTEPLISNAKKRSAANFLDRLKKSTLSQGKSGSLLQTLKESGGNAGNGGGKASASEQKKGGRGDGRKEQGGSRQATLPKQPQEQSASTKRSVGRPPKRPPPPMPPSQPPSKKAREAEKEVSPPPPPTRKRKRGKR